MEFINFIFKNRQNKRYAIIALGGSIALFTIFKILYPFPDFFSDSYSYIFAAIANLDVSIWPIGYSKFLRWFHFITYSDTALIAFQYYFYILSALYFFFTVLYFYKPVKANRIILLIFLFFNPLFLYLCNYVNSDPLFLALSLLWFTELLWILQRPTVYHIIVQGILLFACFTVRNNAYIYPFIMMVAFVLTRLKWWVKVWGSALGLLLIIPFIIHTRNAAYKMTGTKMFSFFTGWQLANNALYMWEYADTLKTLPREAKELDELSKDFYSRTIPEFRSYYLLPYVGNFFIREPFAPPKIYLEKHFSTTDEYSSVVAWGKASVVFGEFGQYIIIHNPKAYFWKFVVPNMRNTFYPPLEKLEVYNLGVDNIDPIAQYWFHLKSHKVWTISKSIQGKILYIFPIAFLILNFYILLSWIWAFYSNFYHSFSTSAKKTLIVSGLFLVLNAAFCSSATIVVIRYQIFTFFILIPFSLLLTEWIDERRTATKLKKMTGPDIKYSQQY